MGNVPYLFQICKNGRLQVAATDNGASVCILNYHDGFALVGVVLLKRDRLSLPSP